MITCGDPRRCAVSSCYGLNSLFHLISFSTRSVTKQKRIIEKQTSEHYRIELSIELNRLERLQTQFHCLFLRSWWKFMHQAHTNRDIKSLNGTMIRCIIWRNFLFSPYNFIYPYSRIQQCNWVPWGNLRTRWNPKQNQRWALWRGAQLTTGSPRPRGWFIGLAFHLFCWNSHLYFRQTDIIRPPATRRSLSKASSSDWSG